MITAIITAAGIGSRLQSSVKKQYQEISGKPLLFWTIKPFSLNRDIDNIIVTLPTNDIKNLSRSISREFSDKQIRCISGGKKRQESVFQALKVCQNNCKYVLIHDGVRPFISGKDINLLLKAIKKYPAVIPVTRVKNTIKLVKADLVISTPNRDELYNALTPQVFSFEVILQCHRKAAEENLTFTDDAALVEHYGYQVQVVETSSLNFKITDAIDLKLAKLIIENSIFEID